MQSLAGLRQQGASNISNCARPAILPLAVPLAEPSQFIPQTAERPWDLADSWLSRGTLVLFHTEEQISTQRISLPLESIRHYTSPDHQVRTIRSRLPDCQTAKTNTRPSRTQEDEVRVAGSKLFQDLHDVGGRERQSESFWTLLRSFKSDACMRARFDLSRCGALVAGLGGWGKGIFRPGVAS